MNLPPDWTRLADNPGFYVDGSRALHVLIEEVLAAHGVPNTAANRAQWQAAIVEAAEELMPGKVELSQSIEGYLQRETHDPAR